MKCPFCGSDTTKVVDSRPADDNSAIRRRRHTRELYQRKKIEDGVFRACYKRPVPTERIQEAIEEIEIQIFNRESHEIPSSEIGEIVMEQLKQLDGVAYVRFASVYREFKDVNTFVDELKKILT